MYIHIYVLYLCILEWVAIPFSRGSSGPRDQTWVSCTKGRFFTIWTTREAHVYIYICTYVGFSDSTNGMELACHCRRHYEMWVFSLGLGRSPEEGMATHSSILAKIIPWTEKPGRLQSTGSQRVGHHWSDLACMHAWWWLWWFSC